jgi:hypothetical protein
MKQTVYWFLAMLATVGVLFLEADTVQSASDLCPMGGVMVKTATVKKKALDWAKNLQNVAIDGADTGEWTVLALSRADKRIAMLVGPGYIFFGVAGRGGEVYPQDIVKAFGRDLRNLREAVKKEMSELRKAGVVQIEARDIQKIYDAVGLGLLEKDGRRWVLKTMECQAVDLPASGL